MLGDFTLIECPRPGLIVLQVSSEGELRRFAAEQFDQVEFITYRPEPPSSVACGRVPPPRRVLATYRVTPGEWGPDTDGEAVAIELLPDGYVPR